MADTADRPLPGMRGQLISPWFAAHVLPTDFAADLGADVREPARRAIRTWWRLTGQRLGPASGLRTIHRDGAVPVLDTFGLRLSGPRTGDRIPAVASVKGRMTFPVVVTTWGAGFDDGFRRACVRAETTRCPWVMGFDGRSIRLWDASRGWDRAWVEFDLDVLASHAGVFAVAWALLRREALEGLTARVASAAREHGLAVSVSLRDGVRDALALLVGALAAPPGGARRRAWRPAAAAAFDQSLTLIYRVLFLLFAESRGLLPTWHRTYRRSYSMETLRAKAESPRRHTGLWASLQALSRLAHAGCRAGDLVVTPFNGRLFAPACTPLGESARLDDELVARALVAMTTTAGPHGRERIAFGDLDVEQLGAVYERVLDYEPVIETRPGTSVSDASRPRVSVGLEGSGITRKASGTFYTPRGMTEYLVRRALEPLVAGRSAESILTLRVLDPAMGSGAFLVAACRFLATAYERAVVAEQGRFGGDVTEAERAGFRRLVAQRCLYGVDVNPTAVQVARLSLWLATLAADKPLTFLDHRLATGNSLVGASLDDLARQPRDRSRPPNDGGLPLFPEGAEAALARTLPLRARLACEPDDDVDTVRRKERVMAGLRAGEGGLARWRRLADLWCTRWFWEEDHGPRPDVAVFADLARALDGRGAALPAPTVRTLQDRASRIAEARRFFHWTLEFPEVFYDAGGRPRDDAGFDAVITNPPWEMARGDLGSAARRMEDRDQAARLVGFARRSGVYTLGGDGHVNLYQLFVERSLALTRRGGRVAMVVPWGLLSDRGSRRLRGALLDRCRVDTLVGFDNHGGVFPVHRGVRFALMSASPGSPTRSIACRFGLRDLADLSPGHRPVPCGAQVPERVTLTPARLERLSGPARAVPYIRQRVDLRILERAAAVHPPLGGAAGWGLVFGRELNASDDKPRMAACPHGLIVVEGKHIQPFRLLVPPDTLRVSPDRLPSGARLGRAVRSWRLGYRDVTGVSNRLALIAALVPPGHVTVHSVVCLKSDVPLAVQAYLCAVLNSAVANFLARAWITTHVGAGLMERLPVPHPLDSDPAFVSVATMALSLRETGPADGQTVAKLQAGVARLYGLGRREFAHVLQAFPATAGPGIGRCLEEWDAFGR